MPRGRSSCAAAAVTAALLLSSAGCALTDGGGSSEDTKKAATVEEKDDVQTVTFQEPEDPGPDPFTKPADVEGDETVAVASGRASGGSSGSSGQDQPFGGSGSNRVCDRDKLIRFLRANPERMREWARVLGVPPRSKAVARYIAKLHPVTLTRDTQITNHAFKGGRAVPFQAILKAGTAVLVDRYGTPVVRCYCGNPLKPAVFTKTAKCTGCPPNYKPPRQCEYGRFDNYDKVYYRREYYRNGAYDEVFIRRQRRSRYNDCYEAYPDPPVVTIVDVFEQPEPAPPPAPRPQAQQQPPPPPAPEPRGLQCDPARSQLEAEQCAERRGQAPEHVPEPEPEPAPQPEPAPEPAPQPAPGICNDGVDNEGVPGLIDGADPNCQ